MKKEKLILGELRTFQRKDGKTIAIPLRDIKSRNITEQQLKTVFAILFDIDYEEKYSDYFCGRIDEFTEGAIENENVINENALPF